MESRSVVDRRYMFERTILRCNRPISIHDFIVAIGFFTMTLEPGQAKITSRQRIAERSATRTDLSVRNITSISSVANFVCM